MGTAVVSHQVKDRGLLSNTQKGYLDSVEMCRRAKKVAAKTIAEENPQTLEKFGEALK